MSNYKDDYIKRSMRINRVANGEAVNVSRGVASKFSTILAILQGLGENFTSDKKTEALAKISKLIEEQYSQSKDESEKLAEKIVESELNWQVSTFAEYTNKAVNTVRFEDALIKQRTTQYQGKLFTQWFRDTGVKQTIKTRKVIEAGFLEGKSIPQVVKEVSKLTNKNNANIKTLVRSNMLHASSIARAEVATANDDLLEGAVWNSTLDVRTTANICGVRDQKLYDNNKQPVGHSYEWGAGPGSIHFNCRSIEIFKMIGIDISTPRPSVGAGKEYQRGDKTTNRGTVRKPTKANREKGIFKVEQKANGTDYEKFLRSQKTDFVADALGSQEKAKAFKNGASLDSVTSNPLGTNLNIGQL